LHKKNNFLHSKKNRIFAKSKFRAEQKLKIKNKNHGNDTKPYGRTVQNQNG